jgi:hypothetical protein
MLDVVPDTNMHVSASRSSLGVSNRLLQTLEDYVAEFLTSRCHFHCATSIPRIRTWQSGASKLKLPTTLALGITATPDAWRVASLSRSMMKTACSSRTLAER